MTTAVVLKKFNDVEIPIRPGDRYVNATAMCKAGGKLWADYARLKRTNRFLAALSRSMGIPIDLLVEQRVTGLNNERGTWVHPNVATSLAQFLSPEFEASVAQWLSELLSTGKVSTLPPVGRKAWSDRLGKDWPKHHDYVTSHYPPGSFSMLMQLVAHMLSFEDILSDHGIDCECTDLPELSVGLCYRNHRVQNPDRFRDADIRFAPLFSPAKGEDVDVRVYPPSELVPFLAWFNTQYMPQKLARYMHGKFTDRRQMPAISAAFQKCKRSGIEMSPGSLTRRERTLLRHAPGGVIKVGDRLAIAPKEDYRLALRAMEPDLFSRQIV